MYAVKLQTSNYTRSYVQQTDELSKMCIDELSTQINKLIECAVHGKPVYRKLCAKHNNNNNNNNNTMFLSK